MLQDVPGRVSQLAVENYTGRTAVLSWEIPASHGAEISRYTILYRPYQVSHCNLTSAYR